MNYSDDFKGTKKDWIVTKEPLLAVYNLELFEMGLQSIHNDEAEANRKVIEIAPELLRCLIDAQNLLTSFYANQGGAYVDKEKAKKMWLNSPKGDEFTNVINKALGL